MRNPNQKLLEDTIQSIVPLLDRVVFVGGVTTYLYLPVNNTDARATLDVDVIIDSNVREYQKAESDLRKLGFQPDPSLNCRHKKGDLILDLMPIDGKILGFTNKWYRQGMANAVAKKVGKYSIKILPIEFFLATKIEAFLGRGQGDFYGSKDIEDIVTVLGARPDVLGELDQADPMVVQFIKSNFVSFLSETSFKQAVGGHFPKGASQTDAQLLADLKNFSIT